MMERKQGFVLWMDKEKGFGFIRSAGQPDHYFSSRDANGPVARHAFVTFISKARPEQKRPQAMDVQLA